MRAAIGWACAVSLLTALGSADQTAVGELPIAGERNAAVVGHEPSRGPHEAGPAPVTLRSPDPVIDGALASASAELDVATAEQPYVSITVADAALSAFGMLPLGAVDPVRRSLDELQEHRRPDGSLPGLAKRDAIDAAATGAAEPAGIDDAAATPAWVVALYEYWLQTADTAFVRSVWPAVLDGYRWGLAHDRDGDLILDRDPEAPDPVGLLPTPERPRQDLGLAAIWLESLRATSDLAGAVGDMRTARAVAQDFERAWSALERRYYRSEPGRYGSEPEPEGGPAPTLSAATSVTALAFSLLETNRVPNTLDALASHRLMTDWGSRTLETDHPRYRATDLRVGAVTLPMTGLAAWGLYNYHRPHAGFTALWALARSLHDGAEGDGAVAFSGARYAPLDRAPPPPGRAASSAIFIAALFRGLLGLQADAPRNALTLAPHLPADWDSLSLAGYAVGGSRIDITITREHALPSGEAVLSARFRRQNGDGPLSVRFAPGLPPGSIVRQVRIDGAPQRLERDLQFDDPHVVARFKLERERQVVVLYRPGVAVVPQRPEPAAGEASSAVRILGYGIEGDHYRLRLEGPAGSTRHLDLISPRGAPTPLDRDGVRAISQDWFRVSVTFDGHPDTYVRREIRLQGPAP